MPVLLTKNLGLFRNDYSEGKRKRSLTSCGMENAKCMQIAKSHRSLVKQKTFSEVLHLTVETKRNVASSTRHECKRRLLVGFPTSPQRLDKLPFKESSFGVPWTVISNRSCIAYLSKI